MRKILATLLVLGIVWVGYTAWPLYDLFVLLRAIEAREAEHGVTVHFVTEQLDGGPPVIQARVAVETNDTEDTLSRRVLALEHVIYPQAVDWFCEGRLRCEAGKAVLDGRILSEPVQFAGIEREKTQ